MEALADKGKNSSMANGLSDARLKGGLQYLRDREGDHFKVEAENGG